MKVLALICMSLVLALVTTKPLSCYLIADVGFCRGYRRMWAYSPFEKKCIWFDYSGCGGNNNRFYTEYDCQKTCNDTIFRPTRNPFTSTTIGKIRLN